MAQQIKKKYLSSEVISYFDDQIKIADDKAVNEKSRAENQEALIRSELSSADDAKLVEAKAYSDSQDALKLQAAKDYADLQDAAKLTEAKEYADLKVAAAKSEIMGGVPASTLDTIKEIADALESEQTATGAILTQIGNLESGKASKAELASGVAEAKAYTDSKIAAIPAVDLSAYETITNVDSKDAAKLVEAKNYADSKSSTEKSERESADANLQSQLDDLDGYAQDVRNDVDNHETRILAIEAKTDGPSFANQKLTIGAELGYLDLAVQVKKIMSCAIGRLAVHEGEDFDLSIVGGKTRISWKGSLLAPSGEECVEVGQNVFVVYAY